ncbi:MarR family transcriptional regulator [Actinocrispum sp. NPDC049592]|uniref:MarR family winged helix-turn-helix transcriptional regulator n=1 Tax=Actinocrispum sp. NPDC049592 TaxID=3154835 RepID=UPI0034315031
MAASFDDWVTATHDLYTAMRKNRGRLAQSTAGLSLSQLSMLEVLLTDGPMTVSGIAAVAGVSGPSATRALKQLERDSVVTRQRSVIDERVVVVTLTDHGRWLVERQREALREIQQQHFASLSAEERENFVDVLQRMAKWIGEWQELPPELPPG